MAKTYSKIFPIVVHKLQFSLWFVYDTLTSASPTPIIKNKAWDFPGGAVVKNPPVNAGNRGSSPGLGRSHMSRSN